MDFLVNFPSSCCPFLLFHSLFEVPLWPLKELFAFTLVLHNHYRWRMHIILLPLSSKITNKIIFHGFWDGPYWNPALIKFWAISWYGQWVTVLPQLRSYLHLKQIRLMRMLFTALPQNNRCVAISFLGISRPQPLSHGCGQKSHCHGDARLKVAIATEHPS